MRLSHMKLTHLPLPEKKTVVPSLKIQPNCFHTETKREIDVSGYKSIYSVTFTVHETDM